MPCSIHVQHEGCRTGVESPGAPEKWAVLLLFGRLLTTKREENLHISARKDRIFFDYSSKTNSVRVESIIACCERKIKRYFSRGNRY
jgi:hypothetical protein